MSVNLNTQQLQLLGVMVLWSNNICRPQFLQTCNMVTGCKLVWMPWTLDCLYSAFICAESIFKKHCWQIHLRNISALGVIEQAVTMANYKG